jgi:hypothetical protein
MSSENLCLTDPERFRSNKKGERKMRKLITIALCAASMLMFAGCCSKGKCASAAECKKACPAAKKCDKKAPAKKAAKKAAPKKAAKKAAQKAAAQGAKKVK